MKPENSSKTTGDKNAGGSKTNTGEPFFKASAHNKALPEDLQQNLESSFQQDFSSVQIQKNSQQAKDMNALAFTQGEQIHFAPGQFNPNTESGKSLIGHEFTHIVQQRSGVVKPTGIMRKGIMVNEDSSLEQEADAMGKKAVTGEPISGYRSVGLGMRSAFSPAQPQMAVVQMAKQSSHYGDWYDDTYVLTSSGAKRRGVDMVLRFKPNANVNAELIGLTQSVQTIHDGNPFFPNSDSFYERRAISSTDAITNTRTGLTDEGTRIDRLKDRNNPIYGSRTATTGEGLQDTPMDNNSTSNPTRVGLGSRDSNANATYQLGFHYRNKSGLQKQDARLADGPSIGSVDVSKNSAQIFETAALALKGHDQGTYFGSVQWGWRTDASGNHTKIPFRVVSEGVPSSTFLKAAEKWNTSKSSSNAATLDLPLVDVKVISNVAGVQFGLGPVYTTLPFGTRVRALPTFVSMTETMIEVVDGPFIGETGVVNNSDLSDERS